jgi:sugar O-acyltransferase (sialic acid O-acetyltransferase NeuD family)
MKIIVVGSGGHAHVLVDALLKTKVEIIGITNIDLNKHAQHIFDIPVLGNDDVIRDHSPTKVRIINGIGGTGTGTGSLRKDVFNKIKQWGYTFASVIHPSAIIARGVTLGEGVQIMAGAIVQANADINENVLINTRASVDHDCIIGAHSHISPGATLSGNIELGASSHIGTGANIIQ